MKNIIEWFIKTTEDLKGFDAHLQEEMQKYANKQCKKALLAGAIIGMIVSIAVKDYIF
jgi:uncharacterized membrane protein